MVDDRLVFNKLMDDMLELYEDLERDDDAATRLEVDVYIEYDLKPMADTVLIQKNGTKPRQVAEFIQKIENKSWEEVHEVAEELFNELQEAREKGLIKDGWEAGRGR